MTEIQLGRKTKRRKDRKADRFEDKMTMHRPQKTSRLPPMNY